MVKEGSHILKPVATGNLTGYIEYGSKRSVPEKIIRRLEGEYSVRPMVGQFKDGGAIFRATAYLEFYDGSIRQSPDQVRNKPLQERAGSDREEPVVDVFPVCTVKNRCRC
jgi:hypothetical protein